MAITEDVEFALQQQGAFYRSHQWSLRVDSFAKAREETKDLPEKIRGKEILNRFYSLYQEPFATLIEEAVRVFTSIVRKLPSASLKERTRIVEQRVKDSIIHPNIRKGPVERWLMEASGWNGDVAVLVGIYEEKVESSWIAPTWLTPRPPERAERRGRQWFLLLGVDHVPVKQEFALRYNKKLDNIPKGLATRHLVLELTTTLECRLMHVLDLNLKRMAATLLPDAGDLERQRSSDLRHEQPEQPADSADLSDRLRYGKHCTQMVEEIKKVQRMYLDRGLSFEEIKTQNPEFLLWSLIFPRLSGDDRDTFVHPGTWARRGDGGVTGYARRVLGTAYNKSPATIQDWIKDYKLHRRKTTGAAITPQLP